MKQSKQLSSFFSNWVPKVFSFLIAFFIVIAIRFLNVNDRIVTLPLSVTLPASCEPVSLVPDTVDVVITGPDSIVYLVDPDRIEAYADFSGVENEGIARVPVDLVYNDDIFTRNGLTVTSRPSSVRILFALPDSGE